MPVPTIDRARRMTIIRVVAVLAGLVALVFAIGPVRHNVLRVAWFPVAWVLRWTGSRYGTGDAFYRVAGAWCIAGGLVGVVSTLAVPLPDAGSLSGSAVVDGLVVFGCTTLFGAILLSFRAADIEKSDGPTSIFTAR